MILSAIGPYCIVSKIIFTENQKKIAIKLPVALSLPKPTVNNVNENVCRKVGMLYIN